MLRVVVSMFMILITSHCVEAAAFFKNPKVELALDSNVLYTISDKPTLTGQELWVDDPSRLPRQTHQYLHFKVSVHNELEKLVPVWFSIGFPAMKVLVVTDGVSVWETGDDSPYSTRPVNAPNYHFPSILSPSSETEFRGYMQGEILRYTFTLGTPEYFNQRYVKTLQRDMAFFGAMALLTALCLVGFITSRNWVFLSFAAFIFSTTFWFFRVFGYAFEILWPSSPYLNDISYALSIYAVLLSAFWVLLQSLAKEGHSVYGAKHIKRFCLLLPFAGLLLWQTLGLDLALRLPVLLFFPFIITAGIVIYVEHKRGSDRAKWLAAAMAPVTFSTLVLTIIALFNVDLYLEPIATFMTGIVLTCLFMVSLTANYMVKVVQRERDTQKRAAKLRSEQTSKLEALVKERTKALEDTNKTLADIASKDSLTNLPNRRTLDLFVDNTFTHGNEEHEVLAVALIDLDHFKSINDTFGHDIGDEVLKTIAELLSPLNNDKQVAARYGGEEFAIVQRYPAYQKTLNDDLDAFAAQLNDVHANINALRIEALQGRTIGASFGWTLCESSSDIVCAFRRADKALYTAKDKGRNVIIKAF